MRAPVMGVLLMAGVASAQDMAVPMSQAPKIVPMFTLMASVIAAPDPHLPDAFKAAHGSETLKTTLEVCLDTTGHVALVKPVVSIGDATVDASIADQVKRTWLYKPQPLPVCFRKPFNFVVHGAASSPASSTEQLAKVREVTDGLLHDIIAGDLRAAYTKLAPGVRANVTQAQLADSVAKNEAQYGKLLSADFVSEMLRAEMLPSGERISVWSDRYSIGTTTIPKGIQFVDVDVVLDVMRAPTILRWRYVSKAQAAAMQTRLLMPNPKLPNSVFASTDEVTATLEVCTGPTGRVDSVRPIKGLSDATLETDIEEQIKRTWQLQPSTARTCAERSFRWLNPSRTKGSTIPTGSNEPAPSTAQPKTVPPFIAQSAITSSPMPHLPDAFKTAHFGATFHATYRICAGTDTHVSSVTKVMSELDDVADTAVIDQIQKTWTFKPATEPMCFAKPMAFVIH